jgi:hypothetical protein
MHTQLLLLLPANHSSTPNKPPACIITLTVTHKIGFVDWAAVFHQQSRNLFVSPVACSNQGGPQRLHKHQQHTTASTTTSIQALHTVWFKLTLSTSLTSAPCSNSNVTIAASDFVTANMSAVLLSYPQFKHKITINGEQK